MNHIDEKKGFDKVPDTANGQVSDYLDRVTSCAPADTF